MSALATLLEARALGLTVRRAGPELRLEPRRLLTPALRAGIVANKAEIMQLLVDEDRASVDRSEAQVERDAIQNEPAAEPDREPWSETQARQIVDATNMDMAALWDPERYGVPRFKQFDRELAAAFKAVSLSQVRAACRSYREWMTSGQRPPRACEQLKNGDKNAQR